jgi:hypothetical protein
MNEESWILLSNCLLAELSLPGGKISIMIFFSFFEKNRDSLSLHPLNKGHFSFGYDR